MGHEESVPNRHGTRAGERGDRGGGPSGRDAAAVHAVERHHAELAAALIAHVEALLDAADDVAASGVAAVEPARQRLVGCCTAELLPHAAAEEGSLYRAAATDERARLLVEAMVAEHRVIEGLVQEIRTADHPLRAAAAGNALRVLFGVHLTKENDLILPLVAADPNVSMEETLAGMHTLLGQLGDHAPATGEEGQQGHDVQAPEPAGG